MKNFIRYIALALLLAMLGAFTSCANLYILVLGDTDTQTEETEPEETEPEETEPPLPKKRVALTFDDGPAYDNDNIQRLTYKLVDKLAGYGGAATFFLVGDRISSVTGEAIKYAADNGCEIGIHAYTHENNFSSCDYSVFIEEINATKAAIEKYSGKEVTLFRPPYGSITQYRAESSGFPIIMWTVDSEDWRYRSQTNGKTATENIQAIVNNILSDIDDGDIILMHEIYKNSYEAACIVIDTLSAQGYEFVTVTELLGEESLQAGEFYYNAK